MNIKNTTMAAMALAAITAACSSAPSADGASGETKEAICGNGVKPGCGPCVADPSSPTGGSKRCVYCDDVEIVSCTLPKILVPSNPSAYTDPPFIGASQDETTVHYTVGVPTGCVLQGSMAAYQNGNVWLQTSELDPPGNGVGWETFEGLTQSTLFILEFWCRGYESNKVPLAVNVYYR